MSSFPRTPMYVTEPVFPLTVEQYHSMIEAGTLTEDDPVELIEGVLVFKMPKNPPHSASLGHIADVLPAHLVPGWLLRTQEPITLADGEPEPDAVIVRGHRGDYNTRHPSPWDVALIIEVSDATLRRDRGIKLRSYARAGIAHYWIVNLVDNHLETYSNPTGEAYELRKDIGLGETIALPPDVGSGTLNVSDLFPPRA